MSLDAHARDLVTLKRRWRVFRRVLSEPERTALDFAPAVLACSFEARGLKADTPGAAGVRPTQRWAALAKRLSLPVPLSHQSGRRLAASMFVLHDDGTARVLVEPAEAISTSLVARIGERCAAATELFEKLKLRVRFELLRPGTLSPAELGRLRALGAVRAGTPGRWLTLAMRAAVVTEEQRTAWIPHAPTSYCRVRLMLGTSPAFEAPKADPFAELELLRLELVRKLRKTPLFDRPTFRSHLKRELLPGGIPQSLLPALRLASGEVTRRKAPHLEVKVAAGMVTLCLPGGALFAKARTLLQARARALLLAHALWGFVPDAWITGPQWKKLAQRLGSERARTTVLFALGHEGSSLALRLRTGKEPRMRELDATATLKHVIASAANGHQVEVVGCSQAQELEAIRLSQLAWRAAANASEALSLDLNGRTLVYAGGRFKSYETGRYLERPRRAVPLERVAAPKSTQPLGPTVECEAVLDGDRARLRYRSKGWAFSEHVSLDALTSHLQGAMSICAQHHERPRFVLHLDDAITKHLKSGRVQTAPPATLEVRGDLTRGLVVMHQGQTFGSRELRAAAETLLSAWPVGVRGQLDIRHASVSVGGLHGEAIACLYARSLIGRRLSAHIDALVGLNGRERRDERVFEG
ncbi:MAG: hypothetical protein JNK82_44540 [Myxococcaceae bacterium]|nr:hypothetical protein [Myxococcaceae bacterium]